MLIDLLDLVGLDALAQVDLGERRHRHQGTEALGRMSAQIMHTAWSRLHRRGWVTGDSAPSHAAHPVPARRRRDAAQPGPGDRASPTSRCRNARRWPGWPTGPPGDDAAGWRHERAERASEAQSAALRAPPSEARSAHEPDRPVNAGPWLPVPPPGYGGIENVVATLVPELRALGVEVVLASVGSSTAAGRRAGLGLRRRPVRLRCSGRTTRSAGSRRRTCAGVVRELRSRDDIDLVHDHVEAVGLATLAAMGADAPPVLHTLHWDLAKHPELYGGFDGGDRVRVNGVSASQLARAPQALRDHAVGHVHLATPLAVDADRARRSDKGELRGHARAGSRRARGRTSAARLAHEAGFDLVLAGPVGPYQQPDDLATALADPATAGNPDVRFWAEQVAPHVDGDRVRWIGTVGGSDARRPRGRRPGDAVPAALGGARRHVRRRVARAGHAGRGHRPRLPAGADRARRTGLLADDEEDLADLVIAADKIDPAECRREAARRFTPAVMARRYVELYEEVVRAA